MFVKRFLTSIRHPQAIILQLLFPIVLTICALLIIKLVSSNRVDPDLVLSMSNLQGTNGYTADFREGAAASQRSPLNLVKEGVGVGSLMIGMHD